MELLTRLFRRLRLLTSADDVERSMDVEMRHHLDEEAADLVRQGLDPAAARREALVRFGGVDQAKERGRDARGGRPVQDAIADLKYAARILIRHRGLTLASVTAMALGISATTAILSVVYGVLLRPLPYRDPDRLMVLWEHDVVRHRADNVVSLDNFEAWQQRARSFSSMAAVIPTSATFTEGPEPERVVGAEVTAGYFSLLGVSPALGRDFNESDHRDTLSILLSDGYWRRRFGSDPSVVGRVRTISGRPYTIVGVMPPFDPPRIAWLETQDVWFPMPLTAERRAWGRSLIVLGRLRDGVTSDEARAEMKSIAARLAVESQANQGWSAAVVPLATEMTGAAVPTLLVLLAAAVILLAIAVTNVATLALAATRRRREELAVRRAIGASDGRLFRQLFTESTLLALLGASLGVGLTPAAVQLLLTLLPPDLPRLADVRADGPVLAIAGVVAAVTTLAFGVATAHRGRDATRGSVLMPAAHGSRSPRAAAGTFVIVEVALAVALSVAAMMMARSLAALHAAPLGFDPSGVVARVSLPEDRYASATSQREFFDRLLDRVRTMPGVAAAGMVSARPLSGMGPSTTVSDADGPPPDTAAPVADVRTIDNGGLEALGMRIVEGRGFDESTSASAAPQMVVTQDLAARLWPRQRAVGRRLSAKIYDNITGEIVGVVEPVRLVGPRTAPRPALFLSARRFTSSQRDIVIRAGAEPASLGPQLRSAAASLDRALPIYMIAEMRDLVGAGLARDRFVTIMLATFATAALLLAAIGVFGVCSADVSLRRREIGVRMALGSTPGGLVAVLLVRTLRRVSVGIAAGGALALVAGRGMSAILFGVSPFDPVSFAVVVLLALAIAVAATVAPSVRAVRGQPLSVLREN